MLGISSQGKSSINQIIEDMFDKIALQLIGEIPKLKRRKTLVISSRKNYNLSHLFVQSMANKQPNAVERDALKSLLVSANGYVESLKNRTKSTITERIDGLAKESGFKKRKLEESEIQSIISEEMQKAKSHLKTIAESEGTKLRNIGSAMEISKVASNIGDEDPTVFFTVVRDKVTCSECIRLHMMPDKSTPRAWKFSEIKHGFHKRGEDTPSISGIHPHCRCSLTYLSKGFGFKNGKLSFIDEKHDEHKKQNN